ncbi:MAG: hypothetical protein MJ069_06110 [Salinivirgaceae bacterium]|nr:hypothetical protein [Salinivirgaceae bacterium]
MKSKILAALVVVVVTLFATNANGQTNDYTIRKCFNYQRDSCKTSSNIYYRINEEASRSALFVKGQKSRVALSIYNGRDYRVSICHDSELGSEVYFKLIDRETDNVLYNSEEDGGATDFEFTVTQTRDLWVEVEVKGTSNFAEKNADNPDDDLIFVRKDTEIGCVGVLVEHMITPSKGF